MGSDVDRSGSREIAGIDRCQELFWGEIKDLGEGQ